MPSQNYKAIDTDILIIGAGGSGLRAAVEAINAGVSITIVSKSLLGKAHTVMAEELIANKSIVFVKQYKHI